ncbi:MAG: hypothetical protein WC455_25960 [Dehalococcoidia bacterium]|jgi:hypothetical protein
MTAQPSTGAAFIEAHRHELETAFRSLPEYGTAGIVFTFYDADTTRVEYIATATRSARPRSNRG